MLVASMTTTRSPDGSGGISRRLFICSKDAVSQGTQAFNREGTARSEHEPIVRSTHARYAAISHAEKSGPEDSSTARNNCAGVWIVLAREKALTARAVAVKYRGKDG